MLRLLAHCRGACSRGDATLGQVVLLSLVTASVAFTLCETTLFAGLRDWVKGRSAWLGKLACYV
jgi:hypothetical protein